MDENEKIHQGVSDEPDEIAVLSYLSAQRLLPIRIQRSYFGLFWIRMGTFDRKHYWSKIARKMGTLLEAGIPILMVLNIIADKEENLFRKNRWHQLSQCIQSGNDLSSGLQKFKPSPDLFLISMVEAGEKSGTLADCLLEVSKHLEEEVYFAKKIRRALFYPLLLLVIALIIVYTLSLLVLPLYESLFQGFEAELPLVTKALFQFGKVLPYGMTFGIIVIFIFLYGNKKKSWVMPGTRQMRKHKTIMQFCSILYRLTNAGTPLLSSLNLLEQMNREKEVSQLILKLQFAVENGKRLSPVFAASRYFTAEAASMLSVGEETGKFSDMLFYLAQMYQRELEEQWEAYSRIVEPVLILGMSGLVALVAMGVLLPIFDLSVHI